MTRTALSLMFSFALAGSLYAAQNPSSQPQQPSSPPSAPAPSAAQSATKPVDITLTGCLVQGSSPSIFVLENAKLSTDSATSKGKSYVVMVTGAADLKPHLNHQVRIVGAEGAAAAAAAATAAGNDEEKGYPRLQARTVTMVANTCPA